MKWLNKQRSRKGWVEITTYDLNTDRLEDIASFMRSRDSFVTVEYLKGWCRKFESEGKFFYSWRTGLWYFEKAEDAIIFRLKFT